MVGTLSFAFFVRAATYQPTGSSLLFISNIHVTLGVQTSASWPIAPKPWTVCDAAPSYHGAVSCRSTGLRTVRFSTAIHKCEPWVHKCLHVRGRSSSVFPLLFSHSFPFYFLTPFIPEFTSPCHRSDFFQNSCIQVMISQQC